MSKYCDHCKWDDRLSYNEENCDKNGDLKKCPNCGQELYEAEGYEEIP